MPISRLVGKWGKSGEMRALTARATTRQREDVKSSYGQLEYIYLARRYRSPGLNMRLLHASHRQ